MARPTRRVFLLAGGTALAAGSLLRLTDTREAEAAPGRFEVQFSDAEWRRKLTREAYDVLRREGTERAYSSPLNAEKRPGRFACAGCDLPVFPSSTKFDSGTGWPSFWRPLDDAIGTTEDRGFGMTRTAVHCGRCGGHLGHVFNDGPQPTGLRYCLNGVALAFKPGAA